MRPPNENLPAKILKASKKEFVEKGFHEASVRSIANSVGVTTGSIYRYYKNKDALFEALVADPAKALFDRYNKYSKTFSNHSLDRQLSILLNEEDTEIKELVNHLYKHYDAFKLIACCAKGTSYEDYVEKLIEIETKSSLNLVNLMQKEKNICHDIDEQMIHIIASTYFTGIFEIISHDENIEVATKHISLLQEFYTAGWYQILNLK